MDYVRPALGIVILFGIILAGLQAFTMPITSDTVNPGLYAREYRDGNHQFFVPYNDPYVIDYALNLITAPVYGYNIFGLLASSYAVYLLLVLFAGLIAFEAAGEVAGLATAALVANSPLDALRYMVYPVWHGTTLLIILVSIYVYLKIKQPVAQAVMMAGLAILGVLNDSLMVPMFVGPMLLLSGYKYLRYRESGLVIPAMAAGLLVIPAKMLHPSILGLYMPRVGQLQNIIGTAVQPDMALMYLSGVMKSSGGPVLMIIIFVGVLLALNRKNVAAALVSPACALMLVGFLFMFSAGGDLSRYLYLLPVLALVALGSGYTDRRAPTTYIIPIVLIMLLFGNITAYSAQDHDVNRPTWDLVDYLKAANVTHAYGDYWMANLVTYSDPDEQLRVRPVIVVDGKLQFMYLQSTLAWTEEGWLTTDNHPTIVAYSPHDPVYEWTKTIPQKPERVLEYTWYDIQHAENVTVYVMTYNTTLPAWPVESLDEFERRGLKPV